MSETKFVKTKKERNYTVLDNTFIQDASLSWKAKGLMTYLLSLPDDWEIHLSEIEKHSTDGKAALRSAINELKEHGYLRAEQKRKDNRFAEMIYVIIENPAEKEKSLFTDFQKTGKQETEKLNSENRTLQNTNINKVLKEQNTDNISKKPKDINQNVIKMLTDCSQNDNSDLDLGKGLDKDLDKGLDKDNTVKAEVTPLILNDNTEWLPTVKEYEEYKTLYPNVDIETQFRKMRGWLNGNPAKRKTRKGITRFVNNWLSNEQDKPQVNVPKHQTDWSGQATDEEYRAGASNLDTIGF